MKPGEDWAKEMLERSIFGQFSAEEKWRTLKAMLIESPEAMTMVRRYNQVVQEAIHRYRPELILVDMPYLLPAISASKIPWIFNLSVVPTVYCHEDSVPPCCSGLPSNAPRDSTWALFRRLQKEYTHSKVFNDFIEKELGYPRYPADASLPLEQALLVVTATPEELNCKEVRSRPNWFNLEAFNKPDILSKTPPVKSISLKEFVGEPFFSSNLGKRWSGKWVYLSLGSMGSIDLSLMGRLLGALAPTPHKYLVSMGPRHEELSLLLPGNCWGRRYLPQTELLPLVDLVITHGGNNTVTEAFALGGRPLLVFPLFGDQLDNAQRIAETGLGRRLDPYDFTAQQLVTAVEELLADGELRRKMEQASRRILADTSRHRRLVELIERKLGCL